MTSCIIIVPLALVPAANQLAKGLGLAENQFSETYGELGHVFCQFEPTEGALQAAAGPLPPFVQKIDCDPPQEGEWVQTPWGMTRVGLFLSATQGGWLHRATVDGWPKNA